MLSKIFGSKAQPKGRNEDVPGRTSQSVLRLGSNTQGSNHRHENQQPLPYITGKQKHDGAENTSGSTHALTDFTALDFDPKEITSTEELTRVAFETCLNRDLELAPQLAAQVAVLATDGRHKNAVLLVSKSASSDVVLSVVERLQIRGMTLSKSWWCSIPVLTAVANGDVTAQQTRVMRARMNDVNQSALWSTFLDIISRAFAQQANDVDFKISLASPESQIFLKINGRYITTTNLTLPTDTLISMLGIAWQHSKGGAGSKFEPRQEQQCNIDIQLHNGSRLRLRWASMATDRGCTVTFRLQPLGTSRVIQSLEDAGYLPEHVEIFKRAVMGRGGLTTFAGVVGSGKTVSLAILMGMLPKHSKVVSFEDPVEIENADLHQKTISRDVTSDDDRDFQSAVRTLFRSALDTFMLGEVRDVATGRVIRAVLESGHSAFTTTHAGSALGIISKFASPQVGIPLDVLGDPGMLKLNVYQSLMLKNCDCALSADEVADELSGDALYRHNKLFDDIEGLYGLKPSVFRLRNPRGCTKCKRQGVDELTGFSGRTVVAEMIEPDETMCELILSGKKVDLHRYWRGLSDGDVTSCNTTGKSAMDIALLKAAQGVIDPREIEYHFEPFATLAAKASVEKALAIKKHSARALLQTAPALRALPGAAATKAGVA